MPTVMMSKMVVQAVCPRCFACGIEFGKVEGDEQPDEEGLLVPAETVALVGCANCAPKGRTFDIFHGTFAGIECAPMAMGRVKVDAPPRGWRLEDVWPCGFLPNRMHLQWGYRNGKLPR